jgi:hypothetical protein
MEDDARALLVAATEVARFRGALQCERGDLRIASQLLDGRRSASLYADAEASTSPQQLPFDPQLEQVLTSENSGPVTRDELMAYALST